MRSCTPGVGTILTMVAAVLSCQRGSSRPGGVASATMFRGGPRHTGVAETPMASHFGGLLWRAQTNGPVRSTPAIADGTVYVGSSDGRLYALDARTGDARWRFDAGSGINSSPAVAGGRVYLGTQDGSVIALDQQRGGLVWRAALGGDMPLAWGHESGDPLYTSSPTVVEQTLLIGSGDGRLYALDVRNGSVRWSLQTQGRVRSSPAADSGVAYVGSMDGSLYAVDLRTGRLIWRYDTEGHTLHSGQFGFDRRTIQSSPALTADLVIFGARDGFLYAVDRASGQLRWRFDHKISWVNGSPAIESDAVYSGTSDGGFFQRVDLRTGKEVWRDSSRGVSFASPAVAGDAVYAVDASGTLYVRDKRTGAEQWRYMIGDTQANDQIWSSPVLADSVVYFGADDGCVYALRTTAGPALRRAVFWDSAYVGAANFPEHRALRSYLAARGY